MKTAENNNSKNNNAENNNKVIRQYIRRYQSGSKMNHFATQNAGCLVAVKNQNGEIEIGWSLLNSRENQENKEYNRRVKDVNSVSWKARNDAINQGKEENLDDLEVSFPVEKQRKLFDKNKAVEIALNRASSVFSLSSFKDQSRGRIYDSEIFRFIERATKYFKDGVVKIVG